MQEYSNIELIHRIADRIHSARNREILKDKLIHGLTYKELADKYHLSVRGCQYIVQKAQKDLLK